MLAADVDPDANLGLALGLTEEEVNSITPISKMRQLVEERTGATYTNKFFKLNPQVSDIPDKFARDINGVKLLVMGTVETGGGGCVCPEHVMLKSILSSAGVPQGRRGHHGHGGRSGASGPRHRRRAWIASSWSSSRAQEACRPMKR